MGIFSDMSLGKLVVIGVIVVLLFVYGGKNVMNDGGNSNSGRKGNGNDNSTGGTTN